MRVVLDTNVLVAAFIAHGACAEVFERVMTSHELVTSGHIVEEFERVMVRKLRLDAGRVARAVDLVRSVATVVDPEPLGRSVCRDPDDDAVLALALSSRAGVLVIGDDDLLVLRAFEGIPIIAPREFLASGGRATRG
jgi:putative PIN family toxin of toxin-antitoxin system